MDYRTEIDYTSLSTYTQCKRKFLFRFLMNLTLPKPGLDLMFGSAWHWGLENMYRQYQANPALSIMERVNIAVTSLREYWDTIIAPHYDEDECYPKNPTHAADMYMEYVSRDDVQPKTIVGVELPFTLMISPTMSYKGRMDLVTQQGDALKIIDHKTAKNINKSTEDGYLMSYQTDGYLTAGYMYFNKYPSIQYNIALCQKNKIDFPKMIFMKTRAQLDRFLDDLTTTIKDLHANMDLLEQEHTTLTKRTDILQSFRRACGYACTVYFRPCPYMYICNQRANPLVWFDELPDTFIRHEWNPAELNFTTQKEQA